MDDDPISRRGHSRDVSSARLPRQQQDGVRDLPSRPRPSHRQEKHPRTSGSSEHNLRDRRKTSDTADRDGQPESSTNSRSRPRGHEFRDITARDSTRVQLGDTYIEHQHLKSGITLTPEELEKQRQDKFMKDLSFDAMDSRLATIGFAEPTTCSWLFARKEYIRWRDPRFRRTNHGFLWIKGKPGSGKSTMMKHALRYDERSHRRDTSVFSFFFNARGFGLEKTTEGMYRSLLHQLYKRHRSRLPSPLPNRDPNLRQQSWTLPILQDMLWNAVFSERSDNSLTFYIDALDECEEDSIRRAIEYFETLIASAVSRDFNLSICFASRHYPNINMKCYEEVNLDAIRAHRRDIDTFVTQRLCGEDGLITELSQEISRRCQGVFLWAALVVQMMNKLIECGTTRSQLLAKLHSVPHGIEELLKTLMLDGDLALLSTLQWVLFSKEPFDVHQLYFAIETSIGHLRSAVQDRSETSETQMRTFILQSSKGLVDFTRSRRNPQAQFIHETVRGYLLNGGLYALDHSLSGNVEAISHSKLGQWCHDVIKTLSLSQLQVRRSFSRYFQRCMLDHMEIAYCGKALGLSSIDAISQRTWDVLIEYHSGYLTVNPITEPVTPLHTLVWSGNMELAEAVIRRRLACCVSVSDQNQTMLTTKKSELPDRPDVNARHGSKTALMGALRRYKPGAAERVIRLLLECGADPNFATKPSDTPLSLAIQHANCDITTLLLEHGADPNNPISSEFGQSAVVTAVREDDEKLLERLLSFGADVYSQDTPFLLHWATASSKPSIVRQLLEAGANVDAYSKFGQTALHESTRRSGGKDEQMVIAQALLDAGANINAVNYFGRTALMLASHHQQDHLAKLLLDRGADPNLPQDAEILRKLRASTSYYNQSTRSDSSNDSLVVNVCDRRRSSSTSSDDGSELTYNGASKSSCLDRFLC